MKPETTSPFACEADRELLRALAEEELQQLNDEDWSPQDEASWWTEVEATLQDSPPRSFPSQEIIATLRDAEQSTGRAQFDASGRAQVFDDSVRSSLQILGRLRADVDGLLFAMAWEAGQRGLHTAVGLSLNDWVRVRCPWVSTGDAVRIKQVVEAACTHWGQPLGEALAAGRTALHRAALVARTMLRLASSLDPDQQQAYAEIAIKAACDASLNDRELGIVCAKLIHDLLESKAPGEADRTAHQLRSVTSRKIGKGMTRFSIDAPSEEATILTGIMTSALAAPAPSPDAPDERTGVQRRFDAVMTVINRGLTNPGAPPSTARSTVILTLPFDARTAQPSGPGVTSTGEIVSATTAGLLACKGDVTPVWLSPEGEPLQLGKTARYASPGQWKALVVRDKHCTFPGCTVPPQWCDAHHIIWWCRDGDTDIEVLALLCGQHHTFVHLHDLTATIIGGVVVWHV